MDIEKYPLKDLSADDLLDRLGEECSELIHAIFKLRRFGNAPSPRTGQTGEEYVAAELEDVKRCIEEVEARLADDGTFDPLPKDHCDWMGWN